MPKNISPDNIKVGMPIRITRTVKGGEGQALRSTVATYEGLVVEVLSDGVALSNPGYNPDYLTDGRPVRLTLKGIAAPDLTDVIEALDYPRNAIVRATTRLGGKGTEITRLWLRGLCGWSLIDADRPGTLFRHDVDIESGQAHFEILEVIHIPQNGDSA